MSQATVTAVASTTKKRKRSRKNSTTSTEERATGPKKARVQEQPKPTESIEVDNLLPPSTTTNPSPPAQSKKEKRKSRRQSKTEIPVVVEEVQEEEKESDVIEDVALPTTPSLSGADVDAAFASLNIHENLKKAMVDMGFTNMTPIQQQAIPQGLLGRDILASARTGSGKTLAYLIPAAQLLINAKFKPRNGTGVIIIAPTRELALQIFGVATELFKYEQQKTVSIVTGGMPKEAEEKKLEKGVNLLVATPGRLLDHLQHTEFNYSNLKALVIDEADRILEFGFEEDLRAIIKILKHTEDVRQTMLFSATQTRNVKDLAKLSLKSKPHEVHVDSTKEIATADGLEQGYVVCDSDARFMLLFTFLKKNIKKKIIVFFSSCNAVKYYSELLNYIDVPVLCLHGKQKQMKRSKTFFEFVNATRGILLCTDIAARGLDIPAVHWIIQYDPPDDPKEYIHRVGRTARGINGKGSALLFLLPSELKFLKYLKELLKAPLEEYEFPKNKIVNIQEQLQKLVSTIYYLHQSAKEGYRSYIQAYASHSQKDIFNVHNLDLLKVAKSFGILVPPKVDLSLSHMGSRENKTRNSNKTKEGGSQKQVQRGSQGGRGGRGGRGGNFSADNPYGRRQSADKRQFGH